MVVFSQKKIDSRDRSRIFVHYSMYIRHLTPTQSFLLFHCPFLSISVSTFCPKKTKIRNIFFYPFDSDCPENRFLSLILNQNLWALIPSSVNSWTIQVPSNVRVKTERYSLSYTIDCETPSSCFGTHIRLRCRFKVSVFHPRLFSFALLRFSQQYGRQEW